MVLTFDGIWFPFHIHSGFWCWLSQTGRGSGWGNVRVMAAYYYPYCPQPDLTVGITSHTDPGALTIVLQDHVGGLQVKYGVKLVDVKPVPGALAINIGDVLQILSNDEYRSLGHRVLANPSREPRISAAVFFNPSNRDGLLGPFLELISPEKPALFRPFNYVDYIGRYFTKELDGKSLVNFYRLSDTVNTMNISPL